MMSTLVLKYSLRIRNESNTMNTYFKINAKKPNVKSRKSASHDFDTLHASLAWRIIAYRRGIIKFELQSIINRFVSVLSRLQRSKNINLSPVTGKSRASL